MQFEYCADAVAVYQGKVVLVERLSFPFGLAIPGGRRDSIDGLLEEASGCAVREMYEETGLDLLIEGKVGRYDAVERDPRGPKESEVFYGTAEGVVKNEEGKTKVVLVDPSEIDIYKDQFAFDHYQVLKDWQQIALV